MSNTSFSEYQQLLTWTPERHAEIHALAEKEAVSVQMEMLIYLKFWEADSYLKWFAELLRIAHGQPYEWSFVIHSGRGQSGKSRKNIWHQDVIDKLKGICPGLEELFGKAFKSQIRNSIAHSNYSIAGRHIHLNNAHEMRNPDKAIQVISFDEWIDIFHITLTLDDFHTRMNNVINERYAGQLKRATDTIEIVMRDPHGHQKLAQLQYIPERKDWTFFRS